MAGSVIPPPPPGFVLDSPPASASIPPPPPGFVLDQPSSAPSGNNSDTQDAIGQNKAFGRAAENLFTMDLAQSARALDAASKGENYDQSYQKIKAEDDALAHEYPVTTFLGGATGLVGSLGTGVGEAELAGRGLAAAGKPLLERVAQKTLETAPVAGGIGAIHGAATTPGNAVKKAEGAAEEGAIGVGLGGVLHAAEEGAGLVKKGLGAAKEGLENMGRNSKELQVENLQDNLEMLKNHADSYYKQARQAGVIFKPESVIRAAKSVGESLSQEGELNKYDHPRSFQAIKDLTSKLKQGQVSLDTLEQMRRRLSRISQENYGKSDGVMAQNAIHSLDDFVRGLKPEDIQSGNTEAISALQNARKQWSSAKKYETVANLYIDADGDMNKFKRGLNNLVRERAGGLTKRARGFSEEEIKDLKNAAASSNLGEIQKWLGKFGYNPGGGNFISNLEALGTVLHPNPYSAALFGAGTLSNVIRQAGEEGKFVKALDTIKGNAPGALKDPVESLK